MRVALLVRAYGPHGFAAELRGWLAADPQLRVVEAGAGSETAGAAPEIFVAASAEHLPPVEARDLAPWILLGPEPPGEPGLLWCSPGGSGPPRGLVALADSLLRASTCGSSRLGARVSELVSVMHHDLSEPARNMAFFAAILADSDPGEDRRRDYLERIRVAGERLQRLLADLTLYARVYFSNAKAEDLSPAHVRAIAQDAWEAAAARTPEEPPALAEVDPPPLRMPPRHLRRILLELFANAREHHGSDSGTIRCLFSSGRESELVDLRVTDGGPGIDPSPGGRLFRPFYRGQRDDELRTGVGLAMVRALAERSGGGVTLEPRSTGGLLQVVVHLPRAPNPRPS